MSWPDPKCPRNHDPGVVYRRWEHTPDCVRHAPRKIHKEQRITEVHKEIEPMRDFPTRARESGAL
jgi:hypothetical protein